MVGVSKIQRGNANYWLRAVAEGGDDYYTKPGEAPGQWVGSIAARLGLQGVVDADAYAAILEGRDPSSADQLLSRPSTHLRYRNDGTHIRVEPVLGYDVRFAAPKSVSLLYALADAATQEKITAILDEAVQAGIAHLEEVACFVQRDKGGKEVEPGRGLVGMAFRHRMSRSGDPALHVHVVLSNLTQAEKDGKWLSLASPKGGNPLWIHGKSAGVVFQAQMRAGFLREMGLEFEEVRNGCADLKGFPREAIDAASSRSKEIADYLADRGISGPAASQIAAFKTRAAKDYGVDVDARRKEWIELLAPYGLTPESIAEMVAEAVPREAREVSTEDLTAAVSQLEERISHFDQRQLLWALADQLPEGGNLTTLASGVQRMVAGERTVCLHDAKGALALPRYTTARVAEIERRFMQAAVATREAGVAVVPIAVLERVLERHPYLGADQREMIVRVTTGGQQVFPVCAWPGTGKTTAMAVAREAWQAAGIQVVGVATARNASGELKDAGVEPSTSIADLLYRVEIWRGEGRNLLDGTVILVDEASITPSPDLESLRQIAEEIGGKIVPFGDTRQIGAVGPGGLFATAVDSLDGATLTTNRRQHIEVDRELVALVHEGRGSEALDLLHTRGRVIVGEDRAATLGGLLADWHRDFTTGADVVMIARRNRDVDELNRTAREILVAEGALGEAEVIVGERPFAVGDLVLTRINQGGVNNRERWEVVGADAAARSLRLRRLGGDEREVILTSPYLERRTEDGAPALVYAYALTTFGTQGKTFDRAYPLLDPAGSLEDQMVAVSRGREIANVYTIASSEFADPELGPVSRPLSDPLHDLRLAMESEGPDHAAIEVKIRRTIVSLTPAELADRRRYLADLLSGEDTRRKLGQRADKAEALLQRLRGERARIEALRHPPPRQLSDVRAAEQRATERLRRTAAELKALPVPDLARSERPSVPAIQLEAALVERHIEKLARAEIAAARIGESDLIYNTLGPFPDDAIEARFWSRAAHAIATYRLRHGIFDEDHPLGSQPDDPVQQAEREQARRRIEEALLHLEQPRQLSLDHEVAIEV
jgi:conjugative relaxase-like TrwC/TraI family protein